MGVIRDGTYTVKFVVNKLCRAYMKSGKAKLVLKYGSPFANAVEILVMACLALDALDDYPGEIDRTPPFGSEDEA